MTALIAASRLQPSDTLTVSPRAAGEPATKINMKPGQVWTFQDALYALLLSSANDAAAAIGERLGGTLDAFATQMQQAGVQLGLQDDPVLQDPAGLDDNFSVDGGNLLSARDLAIIARAVLAQPLLAQVVDTRVYSFVGPDGAHHRLGNHNRMLLTYPGAIGLKTGYTRRAGEDLIAAARRNGRTLVAVVMGAPSLYKDAADLLDQGFAMAPGAPGTGDTLPAVHEPTAPVLAPAHAGPAAMARPTRASTGGLPRGHGGTEEPAVLVIGLGTAALAVVLRRRQIALRRRRRRAARLLGHPGTSPTWGPGTGRSIGDGW